ncbi:GNAT family N-acetyltransferase [Lachnospiraceae bacterium ZAX-1]
MMKAKREIKKINDFEYKMTLDGVEIGWASFLPSEVEREDEDGEIEIVEVLSDEDGYAYLERIDIDPEYQGHGYGTWFLMELKKQVVSSYLVAPDNADAKRLYERIGEESSEDVYDQGFGVYEM